MKLNFKNCNSVLFCTSFCFCVLFTYIIAITSILVVFHVMSSDQELLNCNAGAETKSSCSSNNIEFNVDVNSSVRTEVGQCTIGKAHSERCAKPKTFVFYDLLSIDRMTSRFGYNSQCALEGSWPVEQNEVWTGVPVGPVEVYRNDDWGIRATVNGSMLAYVPVCASDFVEQPVKVNFTLDSFNHVGVEAIVSMPYVIGSLAGSVVLEQRVEGWWDYSWEGAVESSVTFPLAVIGSVFSTEILLEYPSVNGLTAIKSNDIDARLSIFELGEISDFSFSMTDLSFCDGTFFNIDLCPYIEDFLFNLFGDDLHELVLMYTEMGFADLQETLAVKVLNSTYTEIDFWGLNTACAVIQCGGLTLDEFAEKLNVIAWIHVVLAGVLFFELCCVCGLCYRSQGVEDDTKLSMEIESNPLLRLGVLSDREAGKEAGKYGAVVHF